MSTRQKSRQKQPVEHRPKVEKIPNNQALSSQTRISYSGPIPPASELAKYNEIIPNGAERIMQMAERTQAHQHLMEVTALGAHKSESGRGQIFALFIAIASLLVSAYAMFLGLEGAAMIIGGTTVVGLVAAFITGKTAKKD